MSEHAPDRLWAGIDIPKTIAGVLAAVSAAVVGSFLGVAGTLVGAAVASVVGSVGTEIYHRSIERGKQRLAATFVTAPAAVGTPSVAAAEDESPSTPEPTAPRQYRWGRVAMVAGAVFVLAMGVLSAFELTTGKSAADAVGGKSSTGTTIGSVLKGNDKKGPGATTPSHTASPSATATSDPGADPSTDPSGSTSTEPSADPSSTTTTSPDPASTDTRTTAPAAVDGGTGDQGTQDSGAGGGASADSADDTGGSGGGVGTSADVPQPDSSGE